MSDASLQALADRQSITDCIYRYCRAVDRIDVKLGRSIFHADSTADYGAEIYQGDGRGVIELICEQHRHATVHSHQVTNILIELDGDRAGSESYVVSALRIELEGRLMEVTTWGRYLDLWSRRDGHWGIDRRVVVRDLDSIAEARPMTPLDRGKRDRTDPSYAILARS